MRSLTKSASGFSLIETVIALAVIALAFIGIIGLLGLGLANNQTSSQQTVATNIAASIVADLRSTPSYSTTGKSPRYSLPLPTTVAATPTMPLSGVSRYYLYFDNAQNALGAPTVGAPSSIPSGAVYVAYVSMTKLVQVGPTATSSLIQNTDMARIVVTWPAQGNTPATGNVDIITQFRIN